MVSTRPLISKSLYQSFGDCTKSINYNYHRHFHVAQVFQLSNKVRVFILLFNFFQFIIIIIIWVLYNLI